MTITIMEILLYALALAVLVFTPGPVVVATIAKTLASKHHQFDIDANKELLGLGLAKVIGSFFLAFPNTGSFTRSAIAEQSGAKTGVSSIVAALMIALTLLFFTGAFYHLPQSRRYSSHSLELYIEQIFLLQKDHRIL